jgi:hypothetical protein
MTSKGKKSGTTAKRTSGDWLNYVRTSERVALFNRDADPLAATHLSAKARTA